MKKEKQEVERSRKIQKSFFFEFAYHNYSHKKDLVVDLSLDLQQSKTIMQSDITNLLNN